MELKGLQTGYAVITVLSDPNSFNGMVYKGRVEKLPESVTNSDLKLSVGDNVQFAKHMGIDIEISNEKYKAIRIVDLIINTGQNV